MQNRQDFHAAISTEYLHLITDSDRKIIADMCVFNTHLMKSLKILSARILNLYRTVLIHIGNTYEIVLADAIARYKRLEGYDVYFQTGTDEHGQKIELKAEEKGITPKQFINSFTA